MNFLQRAGQSIKAAMVFSRGLGSWGRFDKLQDPWPRSCYPYLRGTQGEYDPTKAAGNWDQNAVLAVGCAWIKRNQNQARLQVLEENEDGVLAPIPQHPLPALLKRPNGYYSQKELLGATITDYLLDGNAFWLKVRDRSAAVRELWWLPRHMVRPDSPENGSEYLTRYIYRVNGRDVPLDPNDVVHFRYPDLDPEDSRLGRSPVRALVSEIGLDNSISIFNGALVHQGGPGVVIAPEIRPEDPPLQAVDAAQIRDEYNKRFQGTGAGSVMVLTFKGEVTKLGYTPQEMALFEIGNRPEARMLAALGLNGMAIGLSVGDEQRTYANLKEAREAAWEEGILVHHQSMAEDLTRQLLPDVDPQFEARELGWDYSKVPALREDQDAKSKRATMEWEADGLTFNEYREKIGQPKLKETDPRGKMYFSDLKLTKAVETAEAMPTPPESAGDAAANGRRPAASGR
jgi:HK97 family phage portal protein